MGRKMIFMLVVLGIVGLAVPASAAEYYLPGSWNGWDAGAYQMTNNGDGTYTHTITGLDPDTRYEFKVLEGGDWANSSYPGANSWVYSDGSGEVTIDFNTNVVNDGWLTDQYRIGVSTDPGDWTLAGGFGSAGYPDWDNSGSGISMTDQGGGIYAATLNLPAGTYDWKTVNTGTWDSISTDNRSINTANATLTLDETSDVTFYVDAYNGVVKAVPEPATIALLGLGGLTLIRRKR